MVNINLIRLIQAIKEHEVYEKNNVNLEFEAAVCGGVPIIRSLKEGLIANKISKRKYSPLNLTFLVLI